MRCTPPSTATLLTLAMLAAGCSGRPRLEMPALRLGAEFRAGEVRGHVQVPAGGNGGTTSHNRPKLQELGIGYAELVQFQTGLRWGDSEILLRAQGIEFEGSDRLETDLMTHGDFFPAGSLVTAEVGADWITLAYAHHLPLARDVELTPMIGGTMFCFDYEMNGEGGLMTSRSFNKGAPVMGMTAQWRPGGGDFSLTLGLTATTPVEGGMPLIATQELLLGYRVGAADGRKMTAVLGVAFEQIRYDDSHKQEPANEVNLSLGPMLVFGLELEL